MIVFNNLHRDAFEKDAPHGLYLSGSERARFLSKLRRQSGQKSNPDGFVVAPDVVLVLQGNILIDTRSHFRECGKWDCDYWDQDDCDCHNAEKYQVGDYKNTSVRYLSDEEIRFVNNKKDYQ